MKEVKLTRYYLANPSKGIALLLTLVVLREILIWSVGPVLKMNIVNELGGFSQYIWVTIVRDLIIPETCTLYILLILLNYYHTRLSIDSVKLDWRSVSRYEFRLLPVILLSFFVFNPVTQTVRFILLNFPDYSFEDYIRNFIQRSFTWRVYIKYSVPILLIGYTAVNVSLLFDYLKQRQEAQEEAERAALAAVKEAELARAKAAALEAQAVSASGLTSSFEQTYLTHLKGRNSQGELDFPVLDAYFFTIEDRFYYAEIHKGRYFVSKTLNELETELDPFHFFRIKRDYIVNRKAVLDYAYWENGKYIVRLDTPDNHEIVVPRARMQEFREWLQGNQRPPTSNKAADSTVLA